LARRDLEKAGKGYRENLHIFHAEILFRELACEFDQDPMGPAVGVSKQGHDDMTVAEVQERRRSISREGSQVMEESELYTVPAVRVPLLRRG